ncbi:MAG: hypothetical protein CMJ78_12535 [Planctomycetaceae bacterium]|nr:hypothetical protein [Planctomycetaceae bacterium]
MPALLEPPSKEMLHLLRDLRICTLRDLKRCRPRVRRLAHDLPAFDSVWIDALVQARKLTSFQARIIESPQAKLLQVGPCLLVKQLGQSQTAETYLARRINGNERCVLKQSTVPLESKQVVDKKIKQLTTIGKSLAHPQVVIPHAFNWIENDKRLRPDRGTQSTAFASSNLFDGNQCLVTLSRVVTGISLTELLVRRGRFPSDIVAEIGRQLIAGLAVLEQFQHTHGAISLCNVRITPTGHAVMVDAGLVAATHSEFTRPINEAPERYDGIAPELIGTGRPPNISSDIYAIGCLLWQLLAGRPPFPTGDPLAKLAAHQTQRICDVRKWAPDTPEALANAIAAFTEPNVEKRPQSAIQLLERMGTPTRLGRGKLRKFYRLFQVSVPKSTSKPRVSRLSKTAAAALLLACICWGLFDSGARSTLLNLQSQLLGDTSAAPRETESAVTVVEQKPRTDEIPEPDAFGIVHLDPGTTYAAGSIRAVGDVIIHTKGPRAAEILVEDKPLSILATSVRINNVVIKQVSPTNDASPVLVEVQSHQLKLDGVNFSAAANIQDNERAFISWTSTGNSPSRDGYVQVKNVVFAGRGNAIHLKSCPARTSIENCLKSDDGGLIRVTPPTAGAQWQLAMSHLTLRKSGPMLTVNLPERQRLGYVFMQLDNSVLDFLSDTAMIDLVGTQHPSDWSWLKLDGEGSLTTATFQAATFTDPSDSGTVSREDIPNLGGIAASPFKFVGEIDGSPSNSEVDTRAVVGLTNNNGTSLAGPGIIASRLIR